MIDLNIPIAFVAGLASFFAPCAVPLLPAYIGYVTGVSAQELKKKGYTHFRKKLIATSLLYILGFSAVFVILGSAVAGVGSIFRHYDFVIQKLGGIIILILGLEFAGILHLSFLARSLEFKLPNWADNLGNVRAFFVGIIFAAAWTPCVGAILGSILSLAATTGEAARGTLLLFVYSLGISIPFLVVSMTLASAPRYIKFITRYSGKIAKISGVILAILGIMLITDTYKYLNQYISQIFDNLG